MAMIIMECWHDTARLTPKAYRNISEIAQRCAGELGDELPDNDITHGLISSWLRKQPDVEARG